MTKRKMQKAKKNREKFGSNVFFCIFAPSKTIE